MQVKLTKISYIGTLLKVWFIQDYLGFDLDRSHCAWNIPTYIFLGERDQYFYFLVVRLSVIK
jgi:hypothetical protein